MFYTVNSCCAFNRYVFNNSKWSFGTLEFVILLNLNHVCGEVMMKALVS